MSTSGANLRVRVSADLADIKQGLAVLRGDMAKLKREGERSAPDTARWKASLGGIRTQLAGILSVYAALRAVRWYTTWPAGCGWPPSPSRSSPPRSAAPTRSPSGPRPSWAQSSACTHPWRRPRACPSRAFLP